MHRHRQILSCRGPNQRVMEACRKADWIDAEMGPGKGARVDLRFKRQITLAPFRAITTERPVTEHPIDTWHRLIKERNPRGLDALLDADAVFLSPIVHAPQRGKAVTAMYLAAAFQVFFNPGFRYVREIIGATDAMLEFETEIDGVLVNGVDIIKWNEAGRIVEFKVMLRPLKAINLIHQRMAAMLHAQQ